MLKEIFEQPRALRDTIHPRINKEEKKICLDEVKITAEQLKILTGYLWRHVALHTMQGL